MATNKMPWFRLYSEVLDDKKIKRICRATGHSKALVLGVWVTLLALANDSGDRGSLQISDGIPYEIDDIAYETEMPDDQVDTLMRLFEKYDMLHYDNKAGWSIMNWDGRQFKSDNVALRVAKHREKKAQEEAKRYSNVIDTDTDTDIESDTDTDKSLITAFCEITGILKPSNGATYAKWLTEANDWARMGVTRQKIQAAFDTAQEKGYTVARPHSLTNFIRGEISKQNSTQDATDLIMQMVAKGEI